MTGRVQLGVDVLSADIGKENYNNWVFTTYSSFKDFREHVEGTSKFPDLFRSFYCTKKEAKALEDHFVARGMKTKGNHKDVIGVVLLNVG